MNTSIVRSRRGGQTLIIALIILGVLLIIGFVFLGLVNRNILQQSGSRQRTLAGELAEAGVRYCHQQLLTSELGADWQGVPSKANSAKDPDSDLLGDPLQYPNFRGPDGLGNFTRVNFANGRALVRVRFTPTDLSLFQTNPVGALRKPGKARSYLIIESIGRPGVVSDTDPTLTGKLSVKDQSKLLAFCPIGIIESARFITDKHRESRPADIGVPSLPVIYKEDASDNVANLGVFDPTLGITSQVLGGVTPLYGFYDRKTAPPTAPAGIFPALGSIYCNAPLRINGNLEVNVSEDFGDFIRTSDVLTGADSSASLLLNVTSKSGATFTTSTVLYGGAGIPLDSRNADYSTSNGLVRDGFQGTDIDGNPRGIGRKEPPSILTVDPATGTSRYVKMTRDSGTLVSGGNSGRYGHGRNIYVNNFSDSQLSSDEQGRIDTGSAQSLEYDWLNPNNGQQKSGWVGPFYVPRGAYLHLLDNGFTITRDPKGPAEENVWRDPDGTDSGKATVRFRLGRGSDGLKHVLNSLNLPSGSNIDGTLSTADFDTGPVFDGVLYFEGNVRVRGVIPSSAQLNVVSNGTIYIEGSITKSTLDESSGLRLNKPSTSAIALLARQYVCLNTTGFFGPDPLDTPEEVSGVPSAVGYSPIRLRQPDGAIRLNGEELLDPESGSYDVPTSWKPYAVEYTEAGNSNTSTNGLNQSMILTHTMDDGPAAATWIGLDINKGITDYNLGLTVPDAAYQTYLFDESADNLATSTSYFGPGYLTPGYNATKMTGKVPLWGLGAQTWQRYSKFETVSFPLAKSGGAYPVPPTLGPNDSLFAFHDAGDSAETDPHGTYRLLAERTNVFGVNIGTFGSTSSNDYMLARAGLLPHDVRIEATMYAEEGSFFVIPGPWFNPNPNDNRLAYTDDVTRKNDFGTNPEAPFYAEPIDVRVRIIGAVSENMPPPMSVQTEWLKKWGWIPMKSGATNRKIPAQHLGPTGDASLKYVPNLTIAYDPVLATGISRGFDIAGDVIRKDSFGRALPPIPRLPVSPTLAYFGQVNP